MKDFERLNSQIDWQKVNKLLPVIIQDYKSCEVLMLGFMNEEALRESLRQKLYFSRPSSPSHSQHVFCIKPLCDLSLTLSSPHRPTLPPLQRAVSSAKKSLTSRFGMELGGTSSLLARR